MVSRVTVASKEWCSVQCAVARQGVFPTPKGMKFMSRPTAELLGRDPCKIEMVSTVAQCNTGPAKNISGYNVRCGCSGPFMSMVSRVNPASDPELCAGQDQLAPRVKRSESAKLENYTKAWTGVCTVGKVSEEEWTNKVPRTSPPPAPEGVNVPDRMNPKLGKPAFGLGWTSTSMQAPARYGNDKCPTTTASGVAWCGTYARWQKLQPRSERSKYKCGCARPYQQVFTQETVLADASCKKQLKVDL